MAHRSCRSSADQAADTDWIFQRSKIWGVEGVEEKMMWHSGTHELGRSIGKLLEQIVF
jgi:hypothetical protein